MAEQAGQTEGVGGPNEDALARPVKEYLDRHLKADSLAARQAAERELLFMIDRAMKVGLVVGFETNLEEIPKLGLCQDCGRKVRDWALRQEGESA